MDTSKVRRILYEVNGELVPSSVALALNASLEKIFVEYQSGLRLWVNAGNELWQVEGKKLPQFGFVSRVAAEPLTRRLPRARMLS